MFLRSSRLTVTDFFVVGVVLLELKRKPQKFVATNLRKTPLP